LGSTTTLTGGGVSSYTWDNGVTDNVPFTPTSTGIYTVTGTDSNGCKNTAQVVVNVNPLPTVTATATSVNFCAGGATTLNGNGASSYTWDKGVSNNVAFVPTATNVYTVTGVDSNGCVNTAQIKVTVNQLPAITAVPSFVTVCAGEKTSLVG